MSLPGLDYRTLELPTAAGRPRGHSPYHPRPGSKAARIATATLAVVQEYDEHLPMGPRAYAYLLLSRGVIDKTEADFAAVNTVLARQRRAGTVPWSAVSDARTESQEPWECADPADMAEQLGELVARAQFGRQAHQPYRCEVWSEVTADVERYARVCEPWGVAVYSGSGSVPIAATRAAAERARHAWEEDGQRTVLLSVGDFDLNGIRNILVPFAQDVRAWVSDPDTVQVRRVAFVPDQVGLVDTAALAPASARRRAAGWPYTYEVQAEALPPDVRDELLTTALAAVLDERTRDDAAERDRGLQAEALRLLLR